LASGHGQVEQAGRRDQETDEEAAPLHQNDTALLAHQPFGGAALLHQHMVEQQHDAPLHFVDGPAGRLDTGPAKVWARFSTK
jgi:hypothetical protein